MANAQSNANVDRQMSVCRVFNVPVEILWEMWTRPEHIKEWWGPEGFTNTITKMEVKPKGEWEFVMHGPDGTDYKNKHIFKEVVPYEKLVLEHVTAPKFLMEVTFERQGDQTMLTIESTFESAEQLEQVIKVFKADVGLQQNIDRLSSYVVEEPFIIERTFRAPVEKVWAAITDEHQMRKWYFDIPGFKAKVGFDFQFTGGPDDGKQYVHLCKIIEVIPNKKLTHSWRYKGYPGESFVTWELFKENDNTRVKLTHTGLASFGISNPDLAKHNFVQGWTDIVGEMLPKFLGDLS